MKIFRNQKTAQESLNNKEEIYLNSYCPFENGPAYKLCGNWCALFYTYKDVELSNKFKYIILGCKGTDKHLYVEDVEHGK